MSERETERIERMLKTALPPMSSEQMQLRRDLWPVMLNRMESEPAKVPWFDWALLAGVIGLLALSPGAIPVLLFHL